MSPGLLDSKPQLFTLPQSASRSCVHPTALGYAPSAQGTRSQGGNKSYYSQHLLSTHYGLAIVCYTQCVTSYLIFTVVLCGQSLYGLHFTGEQGEAPLGLGFDSTAQAPQQHAQLPKEPKGQGPCKDRQSKATVVLLPCLMRS